MQRGKRQIQGLWRKLKKAMTSRCMRIGMMAATFALAIIGYMIYYKGDVFFSLYSSLKVFVGGFDASFDKLTKPDLLEELTAQQNELSAVVMRVCLEVARWGGLIVAGTFVLNFFRDLCRRLEITHKTRREDAIAVHGSEHYKLLLSEMLGGEEQVITQDAAEKFEARRHVLAFDSDNELLQYLSEHFRQLSGGKKTDGLAEQSSQVYLCLLSAAHAKYSSDGFIINNIAENCARLYWNRYFVRRCSGKPETRIALIGFGHYGQALLSQALLVNVFLADTPKMEYHIFGDSALYRGLHPGIARFAAINEADETRESIFFHDEDWVDNLALLRAADRVILCSDADDENIQMLGALDSELSRTPIHIRCSDAQMLKALYPEQHIEEDDPDARLSVFGTDRMLYTREMILQEKLLENAKRNHALYMRRKGHARCSHCQIKFRSANCIRNCEYFRQEWNRIGLFQQRSNICTADHMEVKLREVLGQDCTLTADSLREYAARVEELKKGGMEPYLELEHRRWMRYHFFSGWEYADIPQKNEELRLHPNLKPYDELPKSERDKDMDVYLTLCTLQQENTQKSEPTE